MVRRLAVFLWIVCMAAVFPAQGYAQQESTYGERLAARVEEKMTREYYKLVDSIARRDDDAEKYLGAIRSYYPYTPQYDPFPDRLEDRLMALAFEAQKEGDVEEMREALKEYNGFVQDHLANVDVVFWATSLSEQDARFGNSQFYKWVRKGLVKSMTEGRDGRTPDKAFHIVTFGEEAVILGRIRGKHLGTDLRMAGERHINIHDFEDPETGKIFKIYVDVTIPLEQSLQMYEDRKKAAESVTAMPKL